MLDALFVAILIVCATPLAGAILFLLVFLPLSLRGNALLPPFAPKAVDGAVTIEDAVRACRERNGTELERIAYARSLCARKFEYSRRNPWDSPERCFERGYGYCVQQALAFELICRGLGISCEPVQALRCRFPAGTVHGEPVPVRISGHMWLRVRSGGLIFDIDPSNADLPPGILGFEILSRVTNPPRWLIALAHVFSAAENARRDLPALLGARRNA
jgi:hypothetical protein